MRYYYFTSQINGVLRDWNLRNTNMNRTITGSPLQSKYAHSTRYFSRIDFRKIKSRDFANFWHFCEIKIR